MKKKIAILGSTGSIGTSTLSIIKKKKKLFKVVLLTTKKNYKKILHQSKIYNVKHVIISDEKVFKEKKFLFEDKNISIYNNLNEYSKVNKTKLDFVMSAISGLDGLEPTLKIIKFTKKIAIANKESIICGWNLIQKKLEHYKTEFIPVDSEHFSIWSLLKNTNKELVEKIYITASGGPFLNWDLKKIKNVSVNKALNHPNWSIGKKISIDSATMMNKVFEIIEAKRIFELPKKKFEILIHEKSYVHAIVKLKNGLTKILIHDTKMQIPIFNSIFADTKESFETNSLDFVILNNLNFKKVDYKKFPSVKILRHIPKSISLFETVLITANDVLVEMYLNKKIKFEDINKKIYKIINSREFKEFKDKAPKNLYEIRQLNDYVRLKTQKLCI